MSDHARQAALDIYACTREHTKGKPVLEQCQRDAEDIATVRIQAAIDAATADLRRRLADVTLLAWAANSDCASWDQSRSQFIHGNGVDPVEVLQSEFDTDGVPILDDTTRAALRAAKGE